MTRLVRGLALALLLAAAAAMPAAAQATVAGTWSITVTSDMGTMTMDVVFEQNGSTVTGTVGPPSMPEVEAVELSEGTFENGKLAIGLDVSVQGQWFSTDLTADVDGDEMTGQLYVPDMGYGVPITGKRQQG